MAELAVTTIGADRPGIVAAVARVLADRGGNVEESAMTVLGGHFAIMLLVDSDDDPGELQQALALATTELGLTVSVTPAGPRRQTPEATHLLSVYGSDRLGILAGVTDALARIDANITDLETQVLSADDEPVYAMVIELVAPGPLADAEGERQIEAVLSAACDELGVDHTLRAIETETY